MAEICCNQRMGKMALIGQGIGNHLIGMHLCDGVGSSRTKGWDHVGWDYVVFFLVSTMIFFKHSRFT